jgi:hypothetical protein
MRLMNRHLPRSKSGFAAAVVTLSAVLVMMAPLRWRTQAEEARQAGWLPLVNGGGLVDTGAFHRLAVAGSRDQACAEPQIRPTRPLDPP